MASSLPNEGGGRKPSKPPKGRLSAALISHGVDSDYGSEDNLNWRKRATTVAGPVIRGSLLSRRGQLQGPLGVPHLDLKIGGTTHTFSKKPFTQPAPNDTSLLHDRHSAPITIPTRKSRSSRPTTPLTGREPSFKFLQSPTHSYTSSTHKHSNSKGFTPSPDSQSQSPQSERSLSTYSPIRPHTMKAGRGGPSPSYTPSSPLSPTMPAYSTSPLTQQNVGTQSHNQPRRSQPAPLAIPTLPPFHPANYESRTPSPRSTSRPVSSSHGRQISDAQKKLQRYQRDIVINATRSAVRSTLKSPLPRPSSPRLNPLGSPGPVTPLMLEGQSDYFLTGSGTASTSALKDSDCRDVAERLIAVERDRIAHPERVERHSPAVSPAGGHG
ncbi:MAG: hypothetical protein Q9225_002600 [Loekoesia sp. 1 TL-2023]